MKNFYLKAFVLFLGVCALAALSYVDKAFIPTDNRLVNPGFENGKAYWTPNDSADFSISTTSPIKGLSMGVWDADAGTDTLTSSPVSVKAGNIVGYCKIQTPSGDATHTLEIYDGSSILASVAIASSTSAQYSYVNMVLPADDALSLRLQAHADEPSINIDDCYIGPEFPQPAVEISNRIHAQFSFDGVADNDLNGTYARSGTTVTVTATAHGLLVGHTSVLNFTTGTAVDGTFAVTSVADANTFTVTHGTSGSTSGNVTLERVTVDSSRSYNIGTIAQETSGDFFVNFLTPLASVNYIIQCSSMSSSLNNTMCDCIDADNSVWGAHIKTQNTSAGDADYDFNRGIVFKALPW